MTAPTAAAPIDPAIVTPGVLGFLVFFALIVATWLLLRSFTAQLRKIQVPKAGQNDRVPKAGRDAAEWEARRDHNGSEAPERNPSPPGP